MTNSNELPKPSASLNHDQPDAPLSTKWRQRIRPVAGLAGDPETLMVKVALAAPPTLNKPLYSGWSAPEIKTTSPLV